MWLVVGIETAVAWPTKETRVRYRGHEIILRSATDHLAPSVVMEYHPPATMEQALVVARQFLSALAWVEGMPIREIMVTGGTVAIGVGRGPLTNVINPHFCVDYLPEPQDPKARLALALYREALSINSIAYQFLGFFKVINVLYETGGDQKNRINAVLPSINDHRALERLTALKQEQSDIGQYLFKSGRCAIAHAYDEPLVDPEDPEDNTRLARDLPVIRALAEFLIEHELGIKSQHAVWREYLYELDGFRRIVGAELVERLKSGASIDIRELPPFPQISIRLREQPPLANFEDMASEPTYVECRPVSDQL